MLDQPRSEPQFGEPLHSLTEGMQIPMGTRFITVGSELASAFTAGDELIVLPSTGDVLHLPQRERDIASHAVGQSEAAFRALQHCSDEQITEFFREFANLLENDSVFEPILQSNAADVERAQRKGRSTTRLVLSEGMRSDMVAGLRTWSEMPSGRGAVAQTVDHAGWSVELVRAGLGVVGFVFEGRPNVFADACGVIRSGNTVVFRIGSDALSTAQAIMTHALEPALRSAGLPPGAASLVNSPTHAAGWAMFNDPRLSLAVARGSGPAVAQLGAIARQAGTPTSLHGTGGAWMIAGASADADRFRAAITNSLDRKVCNTLNSLLVLRSRASELIPIALEAIQAAADNRNSKAKLHAVGVDAAELIGADWFAPRTIHRAHGEVEEPGCEVVAAEKLGHEWEWEGSPEVTLAIVDSLDDAVALFNRWSPLFVASLISADPAEQSTFFAGVNAPFVSDGFTRWVDGQYALGTPELGLSNWQGGRLFGRGGVLAGDSVFTLRTRVQQGDPDIHR